MNDALDQSRANLVARASGNGTKQALLIMGHTDVVGVQPDKWYADPFSGLRQDGFVYGRGSLDDKDNLAAGLMVMKLLHRYEVELNRAKRVHRKLESTSWWKSIST